MDLNTMHALSRTCRQFHANLAAYRQQLSKMTLRCDNERMETTLDVLDANTSQQQLYVDSPGAGVRAAAGSAGLRSRKCARDMVAKCRHCSKVVCRVSCQLFLLPWPCVCCPLVFGYEDTETTPYWEVLTN